MTCTHVLDLIDAGPLVEVSLAQLEAARAHASDCATCGPAMKAADALAIELGTLPQPASPPELAAAVMAQIARLEVTDAAPVRARNRSVGAGSLAAVMAGVTILLFTVVAGVAGPRLHIFGIGGGIGGAMPTTMAAALGLTSGLLLYVAGLFAPVAEQPRRRAAANYGRSSAPR